MISQPLPDLTAALRLQTQSQTLRAQLDQAAQEVTTGLSADIRSATRGDLAPIFGIDRELERVAIMEQDLSLAAARAQVAQSALDIVSDADRTLGLDLLGATARGDTVARDNFINQGEEVLRSIVSALNTQFGGRSLFAGAAEDSAALAPSDTILADVSALLAAATSPADALAAVDTYFDAPGGAFETTIYGGATIDSAGVELYEGTRIDYLPRADDPAIREALKSVALVAAAQDAGFAANRAAFDDFVTTAATRLTTSNEGVIALQASLGVAEEQIDTARDANAAERSTLSITRNDLIGVDQFDAAGRLTELESQLEALYVVTGRLSNLSLTNYIR